MKNEVIKKLSPQSPPGNENPSQLEEDQPQRYIPPKLIVHDGDEFIKSLGPAQACSPSP